MLGPLGLAHVKQLLGWAVRAEASPGHRALSFEPPCHRELERGVLEPALPAGWHVQAQDPGLDEAP